MKIWLDDVRQPPDETWTWVKNAHEFGTTFQYHAPWITEISFDHDIASYDLHGNEITGYHCFCIVEKFAFNNAWWNIPVMKVHSSNPAGRRKILQGIEGMARWKN